MIFIGDYHTHTKHSDGKGTVLDNILSAVERGLEEVAIADHSFATIACKMTREKFLEQEREIAKYYESTDNPIKVLSSVEGNILGFGGDIDIPDDIIERLDILHVGF
ncbi:MAG: histidinol-phosphatase, partial [Clostridia bacterium]|nr:histidinol-phosphatase [Clostridia bacterium]